MVDVTISLTGSNGDTIVFSDESDFVLLTGLTGFGIPTTTVRIDDSAADGGNWRHTKKGIRELDLPIAVFGTDPGDVQTKLRRISRLLQTVDGPTRITANYSNGDSVFLEAHYVGGAETQFGSDANGFFCRWVLQMQAPQPYWQTTEENSISVSSGSVGRGLLPQLTKMKLSSSQTLGTISIDNDGDVTVFPIWFVRGPVEDLTISNGVQSFGFADPIVAGSTVLVNTNTGEVVDGDGNSVYSSLSSAPKFFGLVPGTSSIQVTGSNANANTQITCYYSPRYEVIH